MKTLPISKLTFKTVEILGRRKQRDESQGGFASLTVGPPGTGKTSHLLFEANLFMNWYPNELIFWRDSPLSAAQFNRIGDNWKVFVEKDCDVYFRNLMKGGMMDVPFQYFSSLNELIDMDTGTGLAKPGYLNVVYFKDDYCWIDFLLHLRRVIGWKSVFIDEIEDIIPLNPSKREGENKNIRNFKNIEFSNNAKQIRKGLVNLCANTQSEDELDWRFKRKLNFVVYLRGSRISVNSRIKQPMVDNLKMGECVIDWENRAFGKSTFKGYPPRHPVFEIVIQ